MFKNLGKIGDAMRLDFLRGNLRKNTVPKRKDFGSGTIRRHTAIAQTV